MSYDQQYAKLFYPPHIYCLSEWLSLHPVNLAAALSGLSDQVWAYLVESSGNKRTTHASV